MLKQKKKKKKMGRTRADARGKNEHPGRRQVHRGERRKNVQHIGKIQLRICMSGQEDQHE